MTVSLAYLHDTVEDTPWTVAEVCNRLNLRGKKWVKKTLTIAELKGMYADNILVGTVRFFATNRSLAWKWIKEAPFELNATTVEVEVYE